jgi:hypothetical protein
VIFAIKIDTMPSINVSHETGHSSAIQTTYPLLMDRCLTRNETIRCNWTALASEQNNIIVPNTIANHQTNKHLNQTLVIIDSVTEMAFD